MNITTALATSDHSGYPVLRLTIDGHAAYILEPKSTLLDAGIVVLLDDAGHWENTLAEQYRSDGEAVLIRGASRDAGLVTLARRFAGGELGELCARAST